MGRRSCAWKSGRRDGRCPKQALVLKHNRHHQAEKAQSTRWDPSRSIGSQSVQDTNMKDILLAAGLHRHPVAGGDQRGASFAANRQNLVEIVSDPAVDLFALLPNSGEHQRTIVREIHVIASHNACHTGELGILRQVMGLWPALHWAIRARRATHHLFPS